MMTSDWRSRLPSIALVIAAHKREQLLTRTLESLSGVVGIGGVGCVYVVENDSSQCLEDVVKSFSGSMPIRYLFHNHGNKSEALNLVLRQSDEDLLVFLDDDIRLSDNVLQSYAKAFVEYPERTIFGGPVEVDYEISPSPDFFPYMTGSTKGWRPLGYNGWLEGKPKFLGCNWAARRIELLDAGGFDPDFGPGSKSGATGQESAAQAALMRKGAKSRYLADACVWHYVTAKQVEESWMITRRKRSGIELAGIISKRLPPGLRTFALRLALVILKAKFRSVHGKPDALREFDRQWWKAYADSAKAAIKST
ncbi:glycosyltransferase [Rubripirellula amarantea]|nr:glycosyltransferase [Rubripirellula amarantea]